jgi:hypothetical protein
MQGTDFAANSDWLTDKLHVMITIYNTTIDETGIVGVGPLMVKKPTDATALMLHNERSFYFQVYTKWHPFTVSTDFLSFAGDSKERSAKEQTAITEAHKALKRCVISRDYSELLAGRRGIESAHTGVMMFDMRDDQGRALQLTAHQIEKFMPTLVLYVDGIRRYVTPHIPGAFSPITPHNIDVAFILTWCRELTTALAEEFAQLSAPGLSKEIT